MKLPSFLYVAIPSYLDKSEEFILKTFINIFSNPNLWDAMKLLKLKPFNANLITKFSGTI